MINLTNEEINYFWKYINATGYCFEVEEANNKYKNLIIELEGNFIPNNHYYIQKNKWGCECRLYIYNFENLPEGIKNKIVSSYGYGGPDGERTGKYTIRINDNEFLLYLVQNYGLRVGEII